MQKSFCFALMSLVLLGCAKKPTAGEVCAKIVATSVGANCRPGTPTGLAGAAAEEVEFDLPSDKGPDGKPKTGIVLRFNDENAYTKTEQAYAAAAVLAGPHRYGSKNALIFVQMNNGLAAPEGQKVKAVVDAL